MNTKTLSAYKTLTDNIDLCIDKIEKRQKQIQEKLQDIEIQNLTLSECVDFFKNYTLEELLEIPVEIKSYDDVLAKLQQAKKNEKDKKNLTRRYKENERKLMKLRLSLSR